MTSHTELIDRYIATWNETDSQRRKELIGRTWTEDARYIDPMIHGEGRSGIDAMIESVQKQFAGLKFRRASDVDAHNDRLRFKWELGPDGGAAIAGGVDFGVTRDGLLQTITGFIDFAPKPAAWERTPDNRRMQRASELFLFEESPLDSPFVEKIWRTLSVPADSFISVAANHSEIVVTRQADRVYVTLRGPETKATGSPIPQNAEFFGIQFRPGVFVRSVPMEYLVDHSVTLPGAGGKTFWLNSSAIEIPNYNNADAFIDRLIRERILVRDPLIESALNGQVKDLSLRSVQRRFLRATGLTQGAFRQIQRAHRAVELLDQGASILDAVQRTGYADQAHLTRSLKRFIGQTPAQIVRQRQSR